MQMKPPTILADDPVTDFIIDTDATFDDGLCKAYLLQLKGVRIHAITVVGTGAAYPEPGHRNVRKLLRYMGRTEIPTAYSADIPFDPSKPQNKMREDVRKSSTDSYNFIPDLKSDNFQTIDAIELLKITLTKADKPIDIVCIGPHTNIANLLTKHPSVKQKIKRIFVMGGAFHVHGNVPDLYPKLQVNAEFNIWLDIKAAQTTIISGIPLMFLPLDASNAIPVTKDFSNLPKNIKKKTS